MVTRSSVRFVRVTVVTNLPVSNTALRITATKSSEHSGVSDATSAKIKTSSLENTKKAMLKAQERYKEIKSSQSAGAEATVAEANTVALETAAEYEHDDSDESASALQPPLLLRQRSLKRNL